LYWDTSNHVREEIAITHFKFLHAADLHLDSPLLGLTSKSPAFAAKVEAASRKAFDDLIDLAISERCRFVVLAGDIFDGDLRNYQAGLFFISGLRRLLEAGIDVFMILGNHDAENRIVSKLGYSKNVHVFSAKGAETRLLEDVGVAVHGQSFSQRDVTENLAQGYPPAHAGYFNVGVLHTACEGQEGPHARYAPCSVEQLVNHGYDYWALGHVHDRAVLHEFPHVVYPGNLQGRSPRETGSKGAHVIGVQEGRISSLEHRSLDTVRWSHARLDVSDATDLPEIVLLIKEQIELAYEEAEQRAVAVRVTLAGATALHHEIQLAGSFLREELDAVCASISDDVWLERIVVATKAPAAPAVLDASLAGLIQQQLSSVAVHRVAEVLEKRLAEVAAKMPANARFGELAERIRENAAGRILDLANALITKDEADAVR